MARTCRLRPRKILPDPKQSNQMTYSIPSFTPGSEPTEDPKYYSVPDSHPPVTIKFRDYHLDPRRNELAVSTALQRAKVECGDIEEQSVEMDELFYKWESGEVILTIEPHQESRS